MKQIDMGGLSFSERREQDKYYIDKTMLIADILTEGDSNVYLFTRPRRFGKTTNLSMLDAFFNIEYKGNTWFDGLEISEHLEFERYKNAFPVVYIDLKDSIADSEEEFVNRIREAISLAFLRHDYLLDSGIMKPVEVESFKNAMNKSTEKSYIRDSIPLLCRLLKSYHKKGVIILVDEYDRAVSDVFGEECHKSILRVLSNFLGAALKTNSGLQMAYVTGITQIAEESIFSGLNNLSVNNVMSVTPGERFGFTEDEVRMVLRDYGAEDRFPEAKRWYDGYRFGIADVYNPFSIMSYVSKRFQPDSYWANTSSNSVMGWMFERIEDRNFQTILDLIDGKVVRSEISTSLVYSRLGKDDTALFSLMVFSGYLKAVPAGKKKFKLSIPNREVRDIVEEIIKGMNPIDNGTFTEFNRAVLRCDADEMARRLQSILLSGSYMNLHVENAYGLILMTVMHSLAKKYEVRTEYDAGNGRTDIIMRPRREGTVPMVFELKKVDAVKKLDAGLDEAMDQIHTKRYYLGMPGKVILIGMSFCVKVPKVRIQVIDNGPDGFSYHHDDVEAR